MSPESMKALVRRYLTEIWYNHNLDIIGEVFHQDFVGHLTSPVHGPDGVKAQIQSSIQAISDATLTFHHLLVDGDYITVHVTVTGKHTGQFLGVDPTGKEITIDSMLIERFQDGKIIELWPQVDSLSLMQQLGFTISP